MLTKDFILAGKAIFTLEIPESYRVNRQVPPHYTFKVNRKDQSATYPEAWFIYLLTGPDNTSDYTYMGQVLPFNGDVHLTVRSKYKGDTLVVKLIRRALACVWSGDTRDMVAAGFKLHHEGRCGCCGAPLTVPESIESGFGPVCRKKVA